MESNNKRFFTKGVGRMKKKARRTHALIFLIVSSIVNLLVVSAWAIEPNRFHPVPANTQNGLAVNISYLHRPAGQQDFQPLGNGSLVHPGDFYSIQFTPEQDCYVYIFERNTSGRVIRLFPPDEQGGSIALAKAGRTYFIPSQDKQFRQVTHPPLRQIYVIASYKPAIALEEHYQVMRTARDRQNELKEKHIRAELLRTIELQQISNIMPVVHTEWVKNQSFHSPMVDRQIGQVLMLPPSQVKSGLKRLQTKGFVTEADIPEEQIEKLPKAILLNLFKEQTASILPESYPILYEYGKVLQHKLSQAVLIIAVHTDIHGSVQLSQQRAENLKQFLVSQFGINTDRLLIKAYGSIKPMVSNETAEGRRLNNRVEFLRIQ